MKSNATRDERVSSGMIRWIAVIGTLVALVAALASMVGLTSAPSRHAPAIQLETKPAKPVKLTFA